MYTISTETETKTKDGYRFRPKLHVTCYNTRYSLNDITTNTPKYHLKDKFAGFWFSYTFTKFSTNTFHRALVNSCLLNTIMLNDKNNFSAFSPSN